MRVRREVRPRYYNEVDGDIIEEIYYGSSYMKYTKDTSSKNAITDIEISLSKILL